MSEHWFLDVNEPREFLNRINPNPHIAQPDSVPFGARFDQAGDRAPPVGNVVRKNDVVLNHEGRLAALRDGPPVGLAVGLKTSLFVGRRIERQLLDRDAAGPEARAPDLVDGAVNEARVWGRDDADTVDKRRAGAPGPAVMVGSQDRLLPPEPRPHRDHKTDDKDKEGAVNDVDEPQSAGFFLLFGGVERGRRNSAKVEPAGDGFGKFDVFLIPRIPFSAPALWGRGPWH